MGSGVGPRIGVRDYLGVWGQVAAATDHARPQRLREERRRGEYREVGRDQGFKRFLRLRLQAPAADTLASLKTGSPDLQLPDLANGSSGMPID